MVHLLLESVLLEFDHCLVIYTFSTLQQQFQGLLGPGTNG
jgi:hypothetical protein